jgi:ribosomal protein L32
MPLYKLRIELRIQILPLLINFEFTLITLRDLRRKKLDKMVFSMVKCPECGKEVSEGFTFCPHCGSRLTGEIEVLKIKIDELKHNEKVAWLAAILCVAVALAIVLYLNWYITVSFPILIHSWTLGATLIIAIIGAILGSVCAVYAAYLSYKRSKLMERIR